METQPGFFGGASDVVVYVGIYNLKGQIIKNLAEIDLLKGDHSITWNGTDYTGSTVSSGIFFYKIETKNETVTGKLLLLK